MAEGFFRGLGAAMQSFGTSMLQQKYQQEMVGMERQKLQLETERTEEGILASKAERAMQELMTAFTAEAQPHQLLLLAQQVAQGQIETELKRMGMMATIDNVRAQTGLAQESTAASAQARDPEYIQARMAEVDRSKMSLATYQAYLEAANKLQDMQADTRNIILSKVMDSLPPITPGKDETVMEAAAKFISALAQEPALRPSPIYDQIAQLAQSQGLEGMRISMPEFGTPIPTPIEAPDPERMQFSIEALSMIDPNQAEAIINNGVTKRWISSEHGENMIMGARKLRLERMSYKPGGFQSMQQGMLQGLPPNTARTMPNFRAQLMGGS